MTYAEAANEIRLECPSVIRKMYHLNDDFLIRCKKAKSFPYKHSYFYKTLGNNTCIITFLCESKSKISENKQSIHYVWESSHGKTIGSLVSNGVVQIFTSHCINRVRSRLFNNEAMSDDTFILALLNSYERLITVPVNTEICINEDNLSTDSESKVVLISKHGVFFGSHTDDSLEIIMKTFITYDMLYSNQYKALKEQIDNLMFSSIRSPFETDEKESSQRIVELANEYKNKL